MADWEKQRIHETVKHQIMKRTMQRYNLVRIRAKISYMAFIQRQTIPELICNSILESHKILVRQNEIPEHEKNLLEKEKLFQQIMKGDVNSFFAVAQKINFLDADETDHDVIAKYSSKPPNKMCAPVEGECLNHSKQDQGISRESQI